MKSQAVASSEASVKSLTDRFRQSKKRQASETYKDDYKGATPEQVTKAILAYRPAKR